MWKRACCWGLVVLFFAGPGFAEAAVFATPPGQPEKGPGGKDYRYEDVEVTAYGKGADAYWLFEPKATMKQGGQGDGAQAKALPVVLWVHGLNQLSYYGNRAWIHHLVRKGHIVIFPRYQTTGLIDPRTFTGKAAKAAREAIAKCDGKRHTRADTKRFSMVGHSLGGTIIVNLAARHEHYGLPQAGALMPLLPGDVRAIKGLGALLPSLTEDHSTVPAETLMLIVAVERDAVVGTGFAKRIYRRTRLIDARDKDLLILGDDDHGRPVLKADHFLPTALRFGQGPMRVNAHDYALWRWFDALMDAAYHDGRHRKLALGGTPEQLFIGRWSDGKAVRPPSVYNPDKPD